MTAEPLRVGIRPWFPGVLGRWTWLTEDIPAERMAALRIAVALALLLDIFGPSLPYFSLFFGPVTFGAAELTAPRFAPGHYYWSVLRVLPEGWGPQALMGVWIASTVALLV